MNVTFLYHSWYVGSKICEEVENDPVIFWKALFLKCILNYEFTYIHIHIQEKRQKETDLLSTGSLARWLQWQGLGWAGL